MYPQQTRAALVFRALGIQYEKPNKRFLAWCLPSILFAAPICHDLADSDGEPNYELSQLQLPRDAPQPDGVLPVRRFPRLSDRVYPPVGGAVPAGTHDPATVFQGGFRVS